MTAMNKIGQQHGDVFLTVTSGDPAPISGWWRPDEDPAPFRYLEQGESMPRLGGSQTRWTLVFDIAPSDRARVARLRP